LRRAIALESIGRAVAAPARRLEALQKASLQSDVSRHTTRIVVAHAGVDDDPRRRRFDEQRVHGHEVRRQPRISRSAAGVASAIKGAAASYTTADLNSPIWVTFTSPISQLRTACSVVFRRCIAIVDEAAVIHNSSALTAGYTCDQEQEPDA
jgi:hypothetical protein